MRGRIAAQLLLGFLATGCGSVFNQEYTSAEGRFRVQFPGKPTLSEQPPVVTPLGPVVEKNATSQSSTAVRFVSYADYPGGLVFPGNKDSILDDACRVWANEKQLTILSKAPVAIHGHPGREVNFEARPGSPAGKIAGRARFYLVGGRLYHIGIAGPTGRLNSNTMNQFLGSFALLDQGPQAPSVPVAASPSSVPRAPTGFYTIPDPPVATLVADTSDSGSELAGGDRPPFPDVRDTAPLGPPTASAGGASIRSFDWIDENADLVGSYGDAAKSDGNPDQHFRVSLDLPPNTIVEEMEIKNSEMNRWVTRPNDRFWPVAIFQQGRPVSRSHVAQVGVYSGPQRFDLYINTGIGIGPGSAFEVMIVVWFAGNRLVLSSHCQRPEKASPSLARSQRPHVPQRPRQPDHPAAPSVTPVPVPEAVAEVRPSPRGGRDSTEVPVLLKPSAAGASILSFDWLDQKEDLVSSSGRTFGPGGGKDEHFRLVLDLPPATLIEEFVITGGGVLRYTTKPGTRFWPVAVFAENRPAIRGQTLRVGTYSGQWTFDLYVESHNTVRPDHVFGVEVVVMIRGTRHSLTARCQRK
ncbi:MAG: hypothetical protein ACLQGP_09000 [Isosphaeraceae bacterium]